MKEESQIQKQYNSFKESGDLKILFPGMSGNWEKDQKRFTRVWEDNQRLLKEVESFYKKEE
jgi:hypothetical protein